MTPARLSTDQAAEYLGVAIPTIKAWRRRGTGPQWLKLGRRVLYDRTDLDRYMAARRHGGEAAIDQSRSKGVA